MTPASALVRVQPAFFQRYPIEAQVGLAAIEDASELLVLLLEGDHSIVAGRLAGGFRRMGQPEIAGEISSTMTQAGHRIRENDPFQADQAMTAIQPRQPPIIARLTGLWGTMRGPVLARFPPAPVSEVSVDEYMRSLDDIYEQDAYHSLSIEGYQVTPELIQRVGEGQRNPERNQADGASRDALAARGYWLAFQDVKIAVAQILNAPASAASVIAVAHRSWYRALFQPAVGAGLLGAAELAGYRTHPVYIQNSRHVPPRTESMRHPMTTLFDLVAPEEEASVRAVLGHWLLGYIHPFRDGNGRVASFLMNAMLASGGLPWTVIQTNDRDSYMRSLERASVGRDIRPFADFIAERVRRSTMKGEETVG